MSDHPKVFISYSHDSEDHREWVLKLATSLREAGVDAILDQWDLKLGQDMAAFMTAGITSADRVVMVCSDKYVEKANKGQGGVGYERLIVTAEVVQAIDTVKFIPIIRANKKSTIPSHLGQRRYLNFNEDDDFNTSLDTLLREILGAPENAKPPLGRNPYAGSMPAPHVQSATVSPTGTTPDGVPILSGEWFEKNRAAAESGISRLDLTGGMEVRFGLHSALSKSQMDLFAAVQQSQITTFGWPIGILMDKAEYRPKPRTDGIFTEVLIASSEMNGRSSYDYWAAKNDGSFYLLQSYFEDQRKNNVIFFNTRIVRVAETLIFAGRLYSALGAPEDSKLSVRISHRGLRGRVLQSASFNRYLSFDRASHEDASETEFTTTLGELSSELVSEVKRICAPMFMLFDYAAFGDEVYRDIVTRFKNGQVS